MQMFNTSANRMNLETVRASVETAYQDALKLRRVLRMCLVAVTHAQ